MNNSGFTTSSQAQQQKPLHRRNATVSLVLVVALSLSALLGIAVSRLLMGETSGLNVVHNSTSTETTTETTSSAPKFRKKPKTKTPKSPKRPKPKSPKAPRRLPKVQPVLQPKAKPNSASAPTAAREAELESIEECYTENGTEYCDTSYELGGVRVSDDKVRAVYRVNGNTISGQASPKLDVFARKVWSRFVTIVPPEVRSLITTFEVHEPNESAAYVIKNAFGREPGAPENWTFGVMTHMNPDDMDFVLIHEAGHIVTMKDQFTNAKSCATLLDPDDNSCSLPNSFASKFTAKFWTKEMIAQADRNANKLWKANKSQFVDDYAATNPFEDMAETFAFFVLDEPVEGRAAEKVAMFAADPTMAALKSQILARRG